MILTTLIAPGFGVEKTPIGGQLNFQDHDSKQGYQIPCDGDSMVKMIVQMAACLTAEQKKECAPAFTGGIALPGRDFDPSDLGQFPDGPPR